MSGAAPTQVPADRYGTARTMPAGRVRALLWALGAVALAGAVWLGLGAAATPVTWQDVGFTLEDESVEVVFEVNRTRPATPVRCTLEALNHSYAQVGVLDVDIAPGTERSVRLAATVRTSEPAVTGLVKGCVVVEDAP